MPGVIEADGRNGDASADTGASPSGSGSGDDNSLPPVEEFVVVNQEVSIEVNFREQSVQGESRITIYLINPDDPPDEVAFDARQCTIDTSQIRVNNKAVRATYRDPYEALDLPPSWDLTPSNFPVLKSRMRHLLPRRRRDLPVEKREQVGCNPADRSLRIALRPDPPASAPLATTRDVAAADQPPSKLKVRLSNTGPESTAATDATLASAGAGAAASDQPADGLFEIVIPFRTTHIRDGLHFVGVDDSDTRFPHVYTRHSPEPGIAACIFPCLDDPGSRCFWKIHIKTPRTLGDALMQQLASHKSLNDANAAAAAKTAAANGGQGKPRQPQPNGLVNGHSNGHSNGQRLLQLTEEDKLLDMTVVCSGNLVGEKTDELDETKKIMTFEITDHGAAANHIGFAVGPFEHVDLYSGFRTDEDDEKLGASALKIHGYCLPGRQVEVQNTCVALTTAADEFAMTYGRYPYDSFKLCFVDDMVPDTTPLISFGLCSTRLLFPDVIVDRDLDVTRKLVHALAYQYFGAYIVPNQRCEMWLTVGIAYYITDLFLCKLCGNNDYRFRIKTMSDRLADEDRDRPSLHDLGIYTYLGDFEMDFMALKAPLVLFILDKRLTKAAGSASASLARVISKIISKANTSGWGDNNNEIISSESFRRVCEKTSQYQLEAFWNQWVLGSGCPWLSVKQRFNRKRLCVEISIHQTQEVGIAKPQPIRHDDFWRQLVEKRHGTYTRKVERLFTGPMTIRIHEANGTPYEHIVEIREDAAFTGGAKFDIPYNTKYKRLKRNRRNRERAAAAAASNADNANAGGTGGAENNEDMIVFSLGDKLDTPDEMADWGLIDWTEQDEKNMDQESYEWIRIDSDFEWIYKIHTNMPAWMYLSQLQQDRDIVAQQDTLLYLSRIREHAMSATILTRTLYDERYFHGLRTMAANNLARQVWKNSDNSGGGGGADGGDGSGGGDGGGSGGHGGNGSNSDDAIVYRGLDQLVRVFRNLYCYDDATPKPNDFGDLRRYWVQSAIVDAVSRVHYEEKRPRQAQRFLLDLLRFNDNTQNSFSDHLYVARLLVALGMSFCPMTAEQPASATTRNGAGAGSGSSGGAAGQSGSRDNMDMVLTFDDGVSDDSSDMDLGADLARMEVDTEDRQLLESALAEIERYRRMDEWTSSYQNAWTTAALEAKHRLMKAGAIAVDALEFVRYLQDGTIDTVQIKAFEALVDLGLMLRPAIFNLLLATMTTHSSPFMRDQLFKLFCKGLASIAFGEHSGGGSAAKDATTAITNGKTNATGANGTDSGDANKTKSSGHAREEDDDDQDTGGIIIEQGDAITKKHQEEHARREQIDAAMVALRAAVKDNEELLAAMWRAVQSPALGCTEKRNLVDLLEVMFDGDASLLLTVKHPTMWAASRRSPGSLVIDFKKIIRPLKPKPPPMSIQLPKPDLAAVPLPILTSANAVGAVAAAVASAGTGTASAPVSSRAGTPSTATAGSSVNAVPAPTQRTALPGFAPRKVSMPKIKLQTNRNASGSGAGSVVASASATAASPNSGAGSSGAGSGTPILIRKSSMATPATPGTATSGSAAKHDSTAELIPVQAAKRKGSATPSIATVKSPTPATAAANDYFGHAASATKASRSPLPSLVPGVSPNKRKRQDSVEQGPYAGTGAGTDREVRARKLVKIMVPTSYQRKLSPRASHWLDTYRTPSSGPSDDGSIRAAGTSHKGSTASKSGNMRTSGTPSSSVSHAAKALSRRPTPTPPPLARTAGSGSLRSSAGHTPEAADRRPSASSAKVAIRKPLPGSAGARPASAAVPSATAAVTTPVATPSAAPTGPSPSPAPTSKPIFIKFKTKSSNT